MWVRYRGQCCPRKQEASIFEALKVLVWRFLRKLDIVLPEDPARPLVFLEVKKEVFRNIVCATASCCPLLELLIFVKCFVELGFL
jgi:hypothetical protein